MTGFTAEVVVLIAAARRLSRTATTGREATATDAWALTRLAAASPTALAAAVAQARGDILRFYNRHRAAAPTLRHGTLEALNRTVIARRGGWG